MKKITHHLVELGAYIVADPRVCHGEPTFKGTRKLVRDCVELAANGLTIDELAKRSKLPREAIAEALQLAAVTLQQHYSQSSVSAATGARSYLKTRAGRRAKK
jgi:uncharacterized protein (DUF433 family)